MTAVHASARRKGSGPWTQWHEAHVSVQPETRHDGAELVRERWPVPPREVIEMLGGEG